MLPTACVITNGTKLFVMKMKLYNNMVYAVIIDFIMAKTILCIHMQGKINSERGLIRAKSQIHEMVLYQVTIKFLYPIPKILLPNL